MILHHFYTLLNNFKTFVTLLTDVLIKQTGIMLMSKLCILLCDWNYATALVTSSKRPSFKGHLCMQIPHRESYRNVLLVNYLKGCAASEALPIKPIRDEGMFAHCQGRGTIKKTLSLCLPENRPSPPNLSHVQGVADGWACISQAWKSPPNPSLNRNPSPPPSLLHFLNLPPLHSLDRWYKCIFIYFL